MNCTRDDVLRLLRSNTDAYLSGQHISTCLGVTRAAVWKHITELRARGYDISSITNKGYRLIENNNIYNKNEIESFLDTKIIGRNIEFFESAGSTNEEARRLAAENCPEGLTVISDVQTRGRGRLGRIWSSKGGLGIWMSVVLRPEMAPQHIGSITLAAAVAVVQAIREATGIGAGIKWPNDIIIDGKKVCGILTEMSCDPDRINYIIVGIGLNVNHGKEDFSGELTDKATSLYINSNNQFSRARLAGVLLNNLEKIYNMFCSGQKDKITAMWREMSNIFGKRVKYFSYNAEGSGYARDITEDGNLIIVDDDNNEIVLKSGEVSVRGVMGYNE